MPMTRWATRWNLYAAVRVAEGCPLILPPSLPPPWCGRFRLDEKQGSKPIVCFVGGGGKTTAMFALANALAAQGKRVITTTTTRLFASQRAQSPAWCAASNLATLTALLDAHGQCLVTAADGEDADGKARGVEPALVAALAARDDVDAVLIEADGSRARPFKAPAPHEPVIPSETTHVVALVGADVFGKPLNAAQVHRPERVAALGGVAEGTPITPHLVARIVTHAQGGLQHVPPTAHFLPFLNKVEDPADALQADESASLLLGTPRVREVLVGSLQAGRGAATGAVPPLSRRSRTAAIVLAAGMATRFGETKQLLPWQGQPLVAHAAEVALQVCDTVLVVVGHEAERVARAVEHLPVEVIWNEHFASGQGSSVAAGVAALTETSRPFMGEAFFLLADQPLVTPGLLRDLQAARGLQRIAVPRVAGQRGNPVLFDAALFPALRAARGEAGGRTLFDAHRDEIAWLELDDRTPLYDVDTPAEWDALRP